MPPPESSSPDAAVTDGAGPTARTAGVRRPWAERVIRVLPWLFLLVPALWASGHFWPPINHDVGAVLDMSRKWLNGARIYRDIIDVNTPLVFVLYALPELLAEVFGGLGAQWVVGCVIAAIVASSYASYRLLRGLTGPDQPVGGILLPLLVPFLLAVLPPDNSFAQREHVMVVLALPYVLASALRARGDGLPLGTAVAVGLAAGMGFGLKPHFLAIPTLVELYVLTRRPLRTGLTDPVPWAIAAALVAHVLIGVFLTPDYWRFVLPFVFEFYTRVGGSSPVEVLTGRVAFTSLLAFAGTVLASFAVPRLRLVPVAVAFGVGAILAAVAQGKGWPYHTYPALAMAVLAFAATLAGLTDRYAATSRERGRLPGVVMASTLLGLFYAQSVIADPPFRMQQQFAGSAVHQLLQIVQRYAKDGKVLILSPGIYPHYPMVNYAGVETVIRFQTMWPLQGIYAQCEPNEPLYNEPAEMTAGERFVFDSVAEDFARERPSVLIVDRVPGMPRCRNEVFNYLEYFKRHPAFAKTFAEYRPVVELERYVVYRRSNRLRSPDGTPPVPQPPGPSDPAN